jgi:hypothetical protein
MRDKSLLKQILEANRDVWDRPGTRPAVRKNFAAVLDCGTRALGWEVYASDTDEMIPVAVTVAHFTGWKSRRRPCSTSLMQALS